MLTTLSAAAQLSEEYGIPVFPCRPDKKPYTAHGFHDATTNLDAIESAFGEHPDALIGVPTGEASRIVVVDVDPDGVDWYQDHAENLNCGRVHQTRRELGRHLLYRQPADVEVRNSASQVARGVDVRGTGGYIIWWPAHGCKTVGSLEDLTEPPRWLLDVIAAPKQPCADPNGRDNQDNPDGLVREPGRNDYLSREAFRLRKQGSTPEQILDVIRAFNTARCVPPLANDELQVIAWGKKRVLPDAVSTDDFYAYMPMHQYFFVPSRELWPAASVNSRLPSIPAPGDKAIKASVWLDQHRPVDQTTWAPGQPMLIKDKLVSGGGWIDRAGSDCFNMYLPPQVLPGDAAQASRWLDHVRLVYPDSADHLVHWLAHRVQRPGEKLNHALVLGGLQGIGKDTILEPVKQAVGPWNVAEVSPGQVLGRFNGFIKSVILRMSEARDMGEVDRFAFYDHSKTLTAAPPDVLRCDEKHLREHAVMNVTGVIITTNHKTDGIYLPADDRRHYVAWSTLTKDDFSAEYWRDLYRWYDSGGHGHVAAYLRELDLSKFDAKAPPPKTPAFWDIVDSNRAPEDSELADILDLLGSPAVITVGMIAMKANDDFEVWLKDRRNSRQIPHRLEAVGYTAVRNDADKNDGQWKVGHKRVTVYGRKELSVRDRIAAASALCREWR